MSILVTGCTGYIGSHTCVELLNAGYDIVGLDDFSNSKPAVLDRISTLAGGRKVDFTRGSMLDSGLLERLFTSHPDIDLVIDFAAYKAVGDSVKRPVEYYTNNVSSVLTLLAAMRRHQVKRLIFSSSATVYGDPKIIPLTEDCLTGGTTNPYGTSKLFVEQILKDLCVSDPAFGVIVFRYFNPIGAHPSGLLGEDPNGVPANLVPYIAKVACGQLPQLTVFGDDYDTPDGTGIRDYIHIVDLAEAHVAAARRLERSAGGWEVFNLGTGRGYSVLEIVNTYAAVNHVSIPYRIAGRRPGDIAVSYCDPSKAARELCWKARFTLEDMCRDSYHFILRENGLGQ